MPKQPTVDRDELATDFANDETQKHPIHIRLTSCEGPLSAVQLKGVVPRSRDCSAPLSAESRVQL
jgi:hypothetical protein